ncbi:MAG: adenylate/guanylate cyclase domain-containing protein [Oligoflexia bacterium]|nr:adenylate/guanylate cyclase domain-containing protein [Oligoflexia bacterium]
MVKRAIIIILLGLLVSVLHLQLFQSSWGDRIEPLALDLWFNLRGPIAPPKDVALIAMDEASYRILGIPLDKAWPRALHAELLKKLATYGVRRVVIDILFLEEGSDQAVDRNLGAAMSLSPTVIGADSGVREMATASGRFTMEELLEPPDVFSNAAEKVALARLPEDYGYVRRFHVPRTNATRDIPSLYEAAVGDDQARPGDRDFLWYYGPPGAIPTYPYHQVLNEKGALPLDTFKDKIVFLGLNLRTELGPAQKDTYRTPFYERGSMFGVEIQATAAANILEHKWIKRSSAWTEGLILFFFTWLISAAIFSLKPQWAGALLFAAALSWSALAYFSFLGGFFIPGAILMTLVLPVAYLGSTLAYYFVTHRSQQQVERAFQMYLSPEMAKRMRTNPESLQLGGESVFATALFTDIEGFTSITERMSATEVSTMLNEYFTEVMNIVFEYQGTLIKFIGDAVFVLYGAPIKLSDHAKRACDSALAIQREVRKFNATGKFPALNTRVGVNTGSMVVGNLGSAKRFDYTAIGDSINFASRLEGLNKYFGTSVLISESTRKDIGDSLKPLALGQIVVSGKSQAIQIFTVFEEPVSQEVESKWTKALNLFRLRNWDGAEGLTREVEALEKKLSKAAQLYLLEIEKLRQSPPSDEWNGELGFASK